ncbi:hypothetical protein ACH5RR_029759 [Cinchona calisaya]|uniref:Uncharacterized protein n=1 Tax=Cinchona calisaya TaxID=153742 RepID=A0ABD2YSP8_9GENT
MAGLQPPARTSKAEVGESSKREEDVIVTQEAQSGQPILVVVQPRVEEEMVLDPLVQEVVSVPNIQDIQISNLKDEGEQDMVNSVVIELEQSN